MSVELKPCRKCGGQGQTIIDVDENGAFFFVECKECGFATEKVYNRDELHVPSAESTFKVLISNSNAAVIEVREMWDALNK